jgi:hypothetical protein
MAYTLADTAIRAQLHTDIQVAWADTVKIHDDRPRTAPHSGDLPRAFVVLNDQTPAFSGTASMTEIAIPHRYTLTREAKWPTSGTIEAAKVADVQAILNVITASGVYLRLYRWQVTGIRYEEAVTEESQEPIYRVSVDFEVEVLTAA